MSIEYHLQQLYAAGRPRPKHLTVHRGVRGRLSVQEEHDAERQRMVRVARFAVQASSKAEEPPPLYDVVLLGCTADWISLTGFERTMSGSLSDLTSFAQTWLLVPAPLEDLLAAEQRVNELSGQLHELQRQTRR